MKTVNDRIIYQNTVQKKKQKPSETIKKCEKGNRIGRYEVLGILGQGGHGVVYLAEDTVLKKQWAVKQISKKDLSGETDAVLKEARILKELDHYGIPRITEQIEDELYVYLVMDYCKGKSLFQYCSSQKVTETEVIFWGIQLCDILEYLHKQNPPVIFRDIKPANVICNDKHQLKLIDFGIAITQQNEKDAKGTKGFAAPEQYKGEYSVQSDIYNLSATLLWCLGDMRAKALRRILKKGIEKTCTRRYKTVSELRHRLVHLQKKKSRGRRRKYTAAGMFLIGLSCGIFYSLTDSFLNEEISFAEINIKLEEELDCQVRLYLEEIEYKKDMLQKRLKEYENGNENIEVTQ